MHITYTITDESPALATYSFLPIIEAFLSTVNIPIKTADISLAGRILASFPDYLQDSQLIEDDLKKLSELVNDPSANLIKTPNISASIPQLKAAITELQNKGFNIPNYPDSPNSEKEKDIYARYAKILGSAVNPLLRQGNSDRRSTKSVKSYAQKNPYKTMPFDKNSKTRVSYMNKEDFFSNEKAIQIKNPTLASIIFKSKNGAKEVLKNNITLEKDEILDASFMSIKALEKFYEEEIKYAKDKDILLSLHLKATMMKVSDPIIFGACIKVFFKDLFNKFHDEFIALDINPNNGISELLTKIEKSPKKEVILKKYNEILQNSANLYMVDPAKKISNLHVPSDVIIDASMPAMLKNGAKLWNADNQLQDTNALIPDQTYATIYEAVLEFMHQNGSLDPSLLGSVSNVGLMAKKAQEYGSHDKTFIAKEDGFFEILDQEGEVLLSFEVQKGDIFRASEAKIEAILNWIDLGIERQQLSQTTALFWLDEKRPSNKIMIDIIHKRLKEKNAEIGILPPKQACLKTLELILEGKNVISITGNVLRDYLTDLFPILELGTSAKMLSIVPMLNGGAMFETGAGGSAPKQVQQLIEENHLRWDSLGEFLALQASLEFYAQKNQHQQAQILADALDSATSTWLEENKAPLREAKQDDNRTSHFYLALYFAKALSEQTKDQKLQIFFKDIAQKLMDNENKIREEFLSKEGKSIDLGGYYKFDDTKASKIMRPSDTFNAIIKEIKEAKL